MHLLVVPVAAEVSVHLFELSDLLAHQGHDVEVDQQEVGPEEEAGEGDGSEEPEEARG